MCMCVCMCGYVCVCMCVRVCVRVCVWSVFRHKHVYQVHVIFHGVWGILFEGIASVSESMESRAQSLKQDGFQHLPAW